MIDTLSHRFIQSGSIITVDNINELVNDLDNIKINGESGRDYIINTGENVTIDGGKGNDTIEGSIFGETYLFNQTSGANVIINDEDNIKIRGTNKADYIYNTGEHVTISSGKGNDTIDGSELFGEVFQFSYTSGNNVITNFGIGDTLQMTSGNSLMRSRHKKSLG